LTFPHSLIVTYSVQIIIVKTEEIKPVVLNPFISWTTVFPSWPKYWRT